VKVGDLVKLRGLIGDRGGACGTIVEIDEEDMVTVQWWDSTAFIPNPSMEKPTNLMVICEGDG
jgi:hypothetical protein